MSCLIPGKEVHWSLTLGCFLKINAFPTDLHLSLCIFAAMECMLLCVGKTDQAELKQLIDLYQNRLKHYTKFSLVVIDDIKNSKTAHEYETANKLNTCGRCAQHERIVDEKKRGGGGGGREHEVQM